MNGRAAGRSRAIRVAAVCAVQLLLIAAAVAGQLSARLTGDEYLVRVAPVDPIDPFRGAYVALGYPDLNAEARTASDGSRPDVVYVPLVEQNGIWVGETPVVSHPDGPALRCRTDGPRPCGIESFFLPQGKAAAIEDAVRAGKALARLRIDSAGHATVVDIVTGN